MVEVGTNILLGDDMGPLEQEIEMIAAGQKKQGDMPPLWDGRAGERIAKVISGLQT